MMLRYLKLILPAVLVLAAIAVYMAQASRGREVEVVQVQKGRIVQSVTDTGYVQVVNEVKVYSPQVARVARLPVDTGHEVRTGQVIAMLEDPDLDLQVLQLEAQLKEAKATLAELDKGIERLRLELEDGERQKERTEQLVAAGAATRAELERVTLALNAARLEVETKVLEREAAIDKVTGLQQQIDKLMSKKARLVVRSPITGVVLDRQVHEGQVVAAGTLIATVAPLDRVEIRVDVLADEMAAIKPGQRVEVTAGALEGRVLTGRVAKIYPQATEKMSALGVAQRRVPVIVAIDDPGPLRPGYEVKASIETAVRDAVLVLPREAVVTTGDGRKEVLVVSDGRVRRRAVEIGMVGKTGVEIVSGLVEGEEVVRDGSLDLQENAKVIPVRR
jgi:HlyD family secretion protein